VANLYASTRYPGLTHVLNVEPDDVHPTKTPARCGYRPRYNCWTGQDRWEHLSADLAQIPTSWPERDPVEFLCQRCGRSVGIRVPTRAERLARE